MPTAPESPTDSAAAEGMPAVTQGRLVAHSYASSLGSSIRNVVVPLGRQRGLVIGEANSGKTFLMQSHPGAYILNFDASPSVCPGSNAVMFPSPGPDGRSLDERGQPIVLTWEHVQAKVALLKSLAKEGKPRPETVVLDTLPSLVRLLKTHVTQLYGKSDFSDLDGRLGYNRIFEYVSQLFSDLRDHGYGVFGVTHLIKKKVPISDNLYADDISLNMSDGLFRALWGMFDVVIPVTSGWETRERDVTVTHVVNGQSKTMTRKVPERVREHVASFDSAKLEGLSKVRTLSPLARVVLPREGAWQALVAAYDAANKQP